jgi:twitching motility protein PilT
MRTAEVMRLTLDAAETGHLVLATMHSATCGEALNRICMSFPSDLQGSIRAQLADCLVGVVCQRLEYLERWQMRVPRCEVLLPNSGARGTIRAGQFGQISNVIQSGGDEGMWTFDRYQRWMEQQREWVRPSAPPAVAADGEIVRSAARVAPPAGVAPVGRVTPAALPGAPKVAPPGGVAGRPGGAQPKPRAAAANPDAPEEITIDEDLDLEDIAELARKIERRTP